MNYTSKGNQLVASTKTVRPLIHKHVLEQNGTGKHQALWSTPKISSSLLKQVQACCLLELNTPAILPANPVFYSIALARVASSGYTLLLRVRPLCWAKELF